jgi:hypothetical protein
MVFLQSCTVFLPDLRRSCSETSLMCIDACDVISVKREEVSDIDSEGEEVPIAISFPTIKCEQDEVSYISVCLLLGALCHYPLAYCHSSSPYLCPSVPLW